MEKEYDPVPRKFDPNAAQPSAAELEAIAVGHAVAVAGRPQGTGPYPEVNTLLTNGPGVYGYYSDSNRYGLRETVDALREVGQILDRRYPGRRFGVGDISRLGGGDIEGHASHEKGVDVDVRLLRKNWAESPLDYQDENYSHERTQELIDLFWANSKLGVKLIFFNDPDSQGTTEYINHDNHLHVRFYRPGETAAPPTLARGNNRKAANNELQRCLNFWLAATGNPGEPLVVDGDFGQLTYDRVRDFQGAQGIEVNGTAGAATWEQLQNWRA
jgi:peptidoglycan hydrolase-like protein with peptidoglycan-binding domain